MDEYTHLHMYILPHPLSPHCLGYAPPSGDNKHHLLFLCSILTRSLLLAVLPKEAWTLTRASAHWQENIERESYIVHILGYIQQCIRGPATLRICVVILNGGKKTHKKIYIIKLARNALVGAYKTIQGYMKYLRLKLCTHICHQLLITIIFTR